MEPIWTLAPFQLSGAMNIITIRKAPLISLKFPLQQIMYNPHVSKLDLKSAYTHILCYILPALKTFIAGGSTCFVVDIMVNHHFFPKICPRFFTISHYAPLSIHRNSDYFMVPHVVDRRGDPHLMIIPIHE